MFGIGGTELVLILLFAFLIFGPDKLPALAKTLGRAIAKFRDAQAEINEVVKTQVYDPATDKDQPFQKPLETLSRLSGSEQDKASSESFSERKARHDAERARRNAERAAQGTAAKPAPRRPIVSAEELYGTSPSAGSAPAPAVPSSSAGSSAPSDAAATNDPAANSTPAASSVAPAASAASAPAAAAVAADDSSRPDEAAASAPSRKGAI